MMKRSRQNEKKPLFSFGQIIIPLVGLIAVGLLYLGVKMFFFSPTKMVSNQIKTSEIVAQPTPTENEERNQMPSATSATSSYPAENNYPAPPVTSKTIAPVPIEEPTLGKNVIAVPSVNVAPKATNSTKAKSENIKTNITKKAPASTNGSRISNGGWGVQVGSFTEKWRADEVKNKLENAGYGNKVRIIEAVVNGKKYYRVQVYAGGDVSDAKQLEKKMQGMGLPTFVVRY